MADYLPQSDNELTAWVSGFIAQANANLAGLDLIAGDITPISTANSTWAAAMTAWNTAQSQAASARQAKDDAAVVLVNLIRALVNRLQANPNVDSAEKQLLGITVRDAVRTAVTAPVTHPIGKVDTSERLRHTIRFADSTTPTSTAKPAGVMGCEIRIKIGGTPPTDASECVYVATDTKSPYVYEFNGEDASKTVHYMLRWMSTRGEHGPWSETVSATVTG